MTRRELLVRPTAGQWDRAFDRIRVVAFVVGFLSLGLALVGPHLISDRFPAWACGIVALVSILIARLVPWIAIPGKVTEWSNGYTTLGFGDMRNIDHITSIGEVVRAARSGLSSSPLPPMVGPGAPNPEPVKFSVLQGADFEIGRMLLGHESPAPSLMFPRLWNVTVDTAGITFTTPGGPPLHVPWSRVTEFTAEPARTNLVRFAVLGDDGPVDLSFNVQRQRGVFDGYAISAFVVMLSERRPRASTPKDHPPG